MVDGYVLLDGFVRSERGVYTRFDPSPYPSLTLALDINDRGTVAGSYVAAPCGDASCAERHGFLRRPDGTVSTVDVPGASGRSGVHGVNNRGAVVGSYVDDNGLEHGFLLERGRVTPIDPPGATDDPAASNTSAFDINDRGQIVGLYPDAQGTYHGFLYYKGRFTKIDPPDAADVPGIATTPPFGINNRGQVVGQYVDAAGVLHGYLWERKRGFRTIDPPRGVQAPPGAIAGTVAADINDRGQILVPAPAAFYKGRPGGSGS
jgi:probable HAF family extracellular repeat protein